ncbi:hypothetical protein D5S17_09880 [Pseudonocardiaceae bacterium YIM PH 21723]|nr:hypothetical protein D5S17_09880 [Pseudonocardiaceae bacterium YIM PH 21723]
MTTAQPIEKAAGMRSMLPTLLRDIALPTLAYYALHWLGYSDWLALLAGTVVSAAILVIETVRHRKIEQFAALMLAVYGIGLLTSFLTGDARFMLAKDCFTTVALGLVFIGSVWAGKPLIYYSARRFIGARGPEALAGFEQKYRSTPLMQRSMRILSLIWGVGFLAEAAVKLVVIYTLPISMTMAISPFMIFGAIGLLVLFTKAYVKRVRAQA